MADQVTVRFETTGEITDNPTVSDILLSGPVNIFATVDTFKELQSEDLINAVKDEPEGKSIIVYCKDVRGSSENGDGLDINYTDQRYRGAYFHLKGFDLNNKPIWQEILLGTHSHTKESLDTLEKLTNLDFSLVGEAGKLIKANADGTLDFESIPKGLPELPYAIQELINKNKEIDAEEPKNSEWHHLDAPLEELQDTYDWLGKDEDGVYRNLAVGNCKQLYYALRKSATFLNIKYTPATENSQYSFKIDKDGQYSVDLSIEEVLFNTNDSEQYIHLQEKDASHYLLTLPVSSIMAGDSKHIIDLNTDLVFLFNGNHAFNNHECRLANLDKENKTISFLLNKKAISDISKTEVQNVTLLVLYNGKNEDCIEDDFVNFVNDNPDFLGNINDALLKLYINDSLARKPVVPHLYLSNDELGNIHWENKLLPTQHFYTNTAKVKITENGKLVNENGVEYEVKDHKVNILFKDVYFKVDECFPIVLVDNFFAFDAGYKIVGNNIIIEIPTDSNIYDFSYDAASSNERIVKIIIIKNSVGGSLADEIAEKYISKADAVEILSHGKLNLSNYLSKAEAKNFSRIGHTHSQYALKGHKHDFEYANFHHTHPELAKLIAMISAGKSEEEIKKFIEDLEKVQSSAKDEIIGWLKENEIIFEDNSGAVHLTDSNFILSDNTINELNETLKEIGYEDEQFNDKAALSDVLNKLIRLFDIDTVLDDQVILEYDIPITLKNGPIGGVDEAKAHALNGKYVAGTKLQDILNDIFNPYISITEVKEMLTPVEEFTKIIWYITDADTGALKEFNPEDIHDIEYVGPVYFDIILRNSINKECKADYKKGNSIATQKAVIKTDFEKNTENGKYLYSDMMAFANLPKPDMLKDIEFSWKSNLEDDMIFDNYGINTDKLNPDDNKITIKPHFHLDYPDLYMKVVNSLDEITEKDLGTPFYFEANNDVQKTFKLKSGQSLVFVVEDEICNTLKLIDVETNNNIFDFFDLAPDQVVKNYAIYYYELLIPPDIDGDGEEDIIEITLKLRK